MRILVHICCSIDSHFFLQKLQAEHPDAQIVGYFYDPNIHPHEEFLLRFADVARSSRLLGVPLLLAPYDESAWRKRCSPLAHEPERGRRCDVCFDVRLSKSASAAQALGATHLATTLSASPKKDLAQLASSAQRVIANAQQLDFCELFDTSDAPTKELLENGVWRMPSRAAGGISHAAEAANCPANAAKIEFLNPDFRAHGGTQEQLAMAKQAGLYHQNYCGCNYALAASRPDAAELFSSADRCVLPGSIAARAQVFAQAAWLETQQRAFAIRKRKVLGWRLELCTVRQNGQSAAAAVLAYSHFTARRTLINASSQAICDAQNGEILRTNRDDVCLISAKAAARLMGQIARCDAQLAAEAAAWAQDFALLGAQAWVRKWLKTAPSLPLQLKLRELVSAGAAGADGAVADAAVKGADAGAAAINGAIHSLATLLDISPMLILASLHGKIDIAGRSRIQPESVVYIELQANAAR